MSSLGSIALNLGHYLVVWPPPRVWRKTLMGLYPRLLLPICSLELWCLSQYPFAIFRGTFGCNSSLRLYQS